MNLCIYRHKNIYMHITRLSAIFQDDLLYQSVSQLPPADILPSHGLNLGILLGQINNISHVSHSNINSNSAPSNSKPRITAVYRRLSTLKHPDYFAGVLHLLKSQHNVCHVV